jgi:hypothetical protein
MALEQRLASTRGGWRGKMLGRVNHFIFQRHLTTDVLTVSDLDDLPLFLSHTTPPVYDCIV